MQNNPDAFLKRLTGDTQKLINFSIYFHYASAVLLIAQVWIFAFVVQAVVFENQAVGAHSSLLAAFVVLVLCRFGLSACADHLSGRGAADIAARTRSDLYRAMRVQGPVFVAQHGSGALLSSLCDGADAIRPYYNHYLPAKALMILVPLTILAVVFPLDWISGLIMLVTAPLIPAFMILIGKGAEHLNQRQWQTLARMSNHFLDCVQGLKTLKVFQASHRTGVHIAAVADDFRRETMKVLRLAFLSSVTLEFFSTVSIALVAVLIGFRLMWGQMDFMSGFFILLLAPEFYAPLRKMGTAYHARMEAIGGAEKIQQILETDTPVTATGQVAPHADSVTIAFEDVYCTYPDGRTGVQGLTFHLGAGKSYALTGPSGAGKSTVLSLLLGFIPPSDGHIFVNGQSLTEMDMRAWRQNISWVPQSPTLFHGNVMENIRMGRTEAQDEEIFSLCQDLGLHDMITALPQGYHTPIGERGYGLSGGQARCVAVARAFLRDAPLVLLDEPTASMDQRTQAVLQRALDRHCHGKTVLTIAHRLETVRRADCIFYLRDGQVADQGTHAQLMQKNSAYAALVAENMACEETV